MTAAEISTSEVAFMTSHPSDAPNVRVPRWMVLLGAILLEVTLALAMQEVRILGLVHAAAILFFGLYAVFKRNLALVICTLAYTTGSEVLWRQVKAPIFYLAAPYLFILLSVFAVFFVIQRVGRDGKLALLYAALLLPSIVITIGVAGSGARQIVAFALSGPLALATFVMFTSQVRSEPWVYRRVLWVALVSAVGPLTIAAASVRSELAFAGKINFGSQSNFTTSGGFGPVQVSSALSLGIMAAILLIISERQKAPKILASIMAVILGVQVLLTFSRGGSFAVGIAMAVFALTQARNRRVRNGILAVAAISFALAYFVVFPWLEGFTGGAFEARFSNTKSSRTELAANDAEIFSSNFVFGVGPGMTKYQRLGFRVCQIRSDHCVDEASSHTEFTRMLGEHGIAGILSIVLFLFLAFSAAKRAGPGRAFSIAWLTWAVAQMFYANLRIVAVPFAFGLAFLSLTGSPITPAESDPDLDDTGDPEAESVQRAEVGSLDSKSAQPSDETGDQPADQSVSTPSTPPPYNGGPQTNPFA